MRVLVGCAAFLMVGLSSACDQPSQSAAEPAPVAEGPPAAGSQGVALNSTLSFKAGEPGALYLVSGWMPPEDFGAWTESVGEPGIVEVPIQKDNLPASFDITFWALLSPAYPAQTYTLRMAGDDATVMLKAELASPVVTSNVPVGAAAQAKMSESGLLRIEILAPGAKSPVEMGLNAVDTRPLGFGIREIILK